MTEVGLQRPRKRPENRPRGDANRRSWNLGRGITNLQVRRCPVLNS